MKRRPFTVSILSASVLAAGCLRTEPGRAADVGFRGTMNATDSKFVMDGRVTLGGGVPEQDVFHDVIIYFFAENGSLVDSHRVGNLTGFVEVSTTTERPPYYVVINSPDFWEEPASSSATITASGETATAITLRETPARRTTFRSHCRRRTSRTSDFK